jgi:hypothetical protein
MHRTDDETERTGFVCASATCPRHTNANRIPETRTAADRVAWGGYLVACLERALRAHLQFVSEPSLPAVTASASRATFRINSALFHKPLRFKNCGGYGRVLKREDRA